MPERNGWQRYIIALLTSILLLAGAGWLAALQVDQRSVREQLAGNEITVRVTDQKVRDFDKRLERVENGIEDIKKLLREGYGRR